MTVVSDTSAISNLLAIDCIDLLEAMFGEVMITPAVQRELHRVDAHKSLHEKHPWIKVSSPGNQKLVLQLLNDLDLGEAESIALAVEKNASYIIIDELKGRKIATRLGLKVVGILGILIKAKLDGKVPQVRPLIDGLSAHGFRLKDDLVKAVLKRLGEV
jgi:predicted nucleic acid-binding protein